MPQSLGSMDAALKDRYRGRVKRPKHAMDVYGQMRSAVSQPRPGIAVPGMDLYRQRLQHTSHSPSVSNPMPRNRLADLLKRGTKRPARTAFTHAR